MSSKARKTAEAQFKEQQKARKSERVQTEHEAAQQASQEKTLHLRHLRLDKEAADEAAIAKTKGKTASAVSKTTPAKERPS